MIQFADYSRRESRTSVGHPEVCYDMLPIKAANCRRKKVVNVERRTKRRREKQRETERQAETQRDKDRKKKKKKKRFKKS